MKFDVDRYFPGEQLVHLVLVVSQVKQFELHESQTRAPFKSGLLNFPELNAQEPHVVPVRYSPSLHLVQTDPLVQASHLKSHA